MVKEIFRNLPIGMDPLTFCGIIDVHRMNELINKIRNETQSLKEHNEFLSDLFEFEEPSQKRSQAEDPAAISLERDPKMMKQTVVSCSSSSSGLSSSSSNPSSSVNHEKPHLELAEKSSSSSVFPTLDVSTAPSTTTLTTIVASSSTSSVVDLGKKPPRPRKIVKRTTNQSSPKERTSRKEATSTESEEDVTSNDESSSENIEEEDYENLTRRPTRNTTKNALGLFKQIAQDEQEEHQEETCY
ncbi:hypothetical protein FDP41_010327 [Naegleria fowleri]|uniref:Uncharacterized protein n=1 Tax=Naegleria fowleri TaxID=5763 RepID=A0A6A5C8J9_NAEFO|nr:uncharacterized protein FDP41_010327 [Naegleria fowleri]KAF0983262.1 hypothetical protein FDP41_010327 [Naegleria fowleri]CAG4708467.1 unnamed protein product [Naegleria fowleri]